jgi:hypothetical protein
MRKAAPWIAGGVAALLVVLLIVDIVIVSKLRAEVSALAVRVEAAPSAPPPMIAEKIEVERIETEEPEKTEANTEDVEDVGEDLGPPAGVLVATFDESLEAWSVPEWASGSVLRATQPDMFRRGGGALALGYVYSDTPPAAVGQVRPDGKLKQIRFYARTRARKMDLGIGVVEEGGARYELKVPSLTPEDGWKLVSVPPSSMGPARSSRDADRRLDLTKIVGIYVVDRTKDAAGGNVLLIDDLTIEIAE